VAERPAVAEAVSAAARRGRLSVIATLVPLTGDFDLAEDCWQDAVERALAQWPPTAFSAGLSAVPGSPGQDGGEGGSGQAAARDRGEAGRGGRLDRDAESEGGTPRPLQERRIGHQHDVIDEPFQDDAERDLFLGTPEDY